MNATLPSRRDRGATQCTLADVRLILMGLHEHLPLGAAAQVASMMRTHTGERPFVINMPCPYCDRRRPAIWSLDIYSNGNRIAVLRCATCWRKLQDKGEAKVSLALPVWADNRQFAAPCERCGTSAGTELHHWAPRHLFDDADLWPTSYLCKPCHSTWHQVVTPKMSERAAA